MSRWLLLAVLLCCASPRAARSPTDYRLPPTDARSWSDSVLARMSLREKAAQMVWPTVLGDYVSANAPSWTRALRYASEERVGGFTISVGSPLEIAAKLNALQRASEVPLLFGADLEFGAGYRARGGYFLPNAIDLGGAVVFPPEMALGATRDTALAYAQGRVTALEGRALGMHIAYAPILDVNNNPANPVISTRSYGEDPQLVGRMGSAFVHGLQDHGMIATGKHFPGHGDTGINSHLALPVVNASRARLDSVELVPFRVAVREGIGAVMSFHGSMPALDSSGDPGTLSKPVLSGVLRGEMGFDGVIISDAMDMRGVLEKYGAAEAAIRAVDAGADVLIQPVDAKETIDAIVSGVSTGRYSESRLDRSVRRILAIKDRLRLGDRKIVDLDSARAIVGDSGHVAIAREVAERSITLVKDELGQLPLGRMSRGARVLSVTLARRTDLGAGLAFNGELGHWFEALRTEYVDADAVSNDYTRLLRIADSANVVIVSSYVAHAWNATGVSAPRAFVGFLTELGSRGARPILVAMGNPYLLQQVPDVPAYLVAWGGFPVSQRAAARALLGRAPISGRLPVSIPPVAAYGSGEMRSVLVSR